MSAAETLPATHPKLAEALRARLRLERLRAARELLQYVLAFDGLIVWLDLIFPRLIKSPLGRLAAFTWPALFVFFAVVGFMEHRTGRGLAQILASGNPPAD